MDMSTTTADASMSMSTSMSMAMTFFASATTPLYSAAWTPRTDGAYAATCTFLVALAAAHRILLALQHVVFYPDADAARHEALLDQEGWKTVPPGVTTASWRSKVHRAWTSHPFRVASETARGLSEVVTGGVGYLL